MLIPICEKPLVLGPWETGYMAFPSVPPLDSQLFLNPAEHGWIWMSPYRSWFFKQIFGRELCLPLHPTTTHHLQLSKETDTSFWAMRLSEPETSWLPGRTPAPALVLSCHCCFQWSCPGCGFEQLCGHYPIPARKPWASWWLPALWQKSWSLLPKVRKKLKKGFEDRRSLYQGITTRITFKISGK